jgi:hypothetical protein
MQRCILILKRYILTIQQIKLSALNLSAFNFNKNLFLTLVRCRRWCWLCRRRRRCALGRRWPLVDLSRNARR